MNDTIRDDVSFSCFVSETKEYEMNVIGNVNVGYINYAYGYNCAYFYQFNDNKGSVNITYLDTIKRIISGTFEMDLVNQCDDSLKINVTDGVFDLQY